MKRVFLAALAVMVPTAAFAGDMSGYAAGMKDLAPLAGSLLQVQRCQLRSPGWNQVMSMALQMEFQRLASKYHVDPNDAGYDQAQQRFRSAAIPAPASAATCQALAESPTMDRLDALEYKITGGYH